ncbi:hypothetical protein HPB50_003751 [Hyalomma asiaticum]|uniref:Uncharacterized protein n=1 Tax=Hyalomma asiaticum TaxID=266040 RepID=A0ACB7SGF2_HYAAI|nr:hypothetical protein HPB50_003751 [Hyalomma asiaticum]
MLARLLTAGGASWDKTLHYAFGVFPVNVFEIWCVNMATAAVLIVLVAYASNVLPWNRPSPMHPLFLFQNGEPLMVKELGRNNSLDQPLKHVDDFSPLTLQPSYWFPPPKTSQLSPVRLDFSDERFEPASPEAKPIVHVRQMSVSHGAKDALKKVSFQAFDKQATLVVGRNGAGKTTLMNVIAGLQKPCCGHVFVRGYDVVKDTNKARATIGFCPQRDLLFSDLTVWEHLLYFGTLKQMRPGKLRKAAEDMLVTASLEDYARTLVRQLKRGPAKRLGIAIATLSDPQLVLVDEPTSGLDRFNTRLVWDMLLSVRHRSALLVSTHDMTEADVLADRVVGLSEGIVVCNASPIYLKGLYGVGYRVSLKKSTRTPFREQYALSILRKYAPSAELLEDNPNQATIGLHTVDSKNFHKMFSELEKVSVRLGIRSIGLTVSTLKDIYLKLTLASLSLVKMKERAQNLPADLANLITSRGTNPGDWLAVVQVVSLERCLFLRRRWATSLLLGWLLPLLLLVAAFQWMNADMLEQKPEPAAEMRVPVSLHHHYPHAVTFLDDDGAAPRNLNEEGAEVDVYNSSAHRVLLREAVLDYVGYTQHYVFGTVFRGHGQVHSYLVASKADVCIPKAWFNPYAVLSSSLAVDLLSNAVLAFRAADPAARFETTFVIHVPEVVAQGRVHRSSRTGLGGKSRADSDAIMANDDPMTRLAEALSSMAHVWALLAPLALSLTVAVFVAFPSAESCSGFMQLQLMTGMSGWTHCLANVWFDGLVSGFMAIPVANTFAFYFRLEVASNDALLAIYACFSALAILSAYAIAYCSRSVGTAYVTTFLIYALMGSLSMKACLFFSTTLGSEEVWQACAAVPPCAVPVGVIKVIVLEWVRFTCDHMAATPVENTTALRVLCADVQDYRITQRTEPFSGLLKRPVDMCCAMLDENAPPVLWSPFELHPAAVGTELYFLSAYTLLLFAYISCRNSGRLFCTESAGHLDQPKLTSKDIQAKSEAQKESGKNASEDALVASDLHKWYDDAYVVCGLSLQLKQDECLGLLGVNDCGKSTVVRMLCGLTSISIGECHMPDIQLSGSVREWQSHIGYCPQEDALMDVFTGNETLEFFARLRGVPGHKVHDLTGSAASSADIGDNGLELCGTYSSGTRRKLSVAVAIIGCPRVAILDDATSGVDLIGRQYIYEVLQDITRTSACGVLFTSRRHEILYFFSVVYSRIL